MEKKIQKQKENLIKTIQDIKVDEENQEKTMSLLTAINNIINIAIKNQDDFSKKTFIDGVIVKGNASKKLVSIAKDIDEVIDYTSSNALKNNGNSLNIDKIKKEYMKYIEFIESVTQDIQDLEDKINEQIEKGNAPKAIQTRYIFQKANKNKKKIIELLHKGMKKGQIAKELGLVEFTFSKMIENHIKTYISKKTNNILEKAKNGEKNANDIAEQISKETGINIDMIMPRVGVVFNEYKKDLQKKEEDNTTKEKSNEE